MLFKKNFEIIEIRESGTVVTHYMSGTKKAWKEEIECWKRDAKNYKMVGKSAMIAWV